MAVTDLPQPDSPTTASTSPGGEVERDAVDGLNHTLLGGEGDAQLVHRQERVSVGTGPAGSAPVTAA